jgi:hypothetical protein
MTMIDPELAALRDEAAAAMQPRYRPQDLIVEVRGGTREEAAALLGCDPADVTDVLAATRARIQAFDAAHDAED